MFEAGIEATAWARTSTLRLRLRLLYTDMIQFTHHLMIWVSWSTTHLFGTSINWTTDHFRCSVLILPYTSRSSKACDTLALAINITALNSMQNDARAQKPTNNTDAMFVYFSWQSWNDVDVDVEWMYELRQSPLCPPQTYDLHLHSNDTIKFLVYYSTALRLPVPSNCALKS